MDELSERFAGAGTIFERQPDGRVAVSNWPQPRASNPNFLRDLVAKWEQRERGTTENPERSAGHDR